MSRPATSRPKCNPISGTMPVLQYCPVEQLQIDAAYQRSLDFGPSQTLIRRLAMYWDWGLCQPLYVARRTDGGLYVVDGQHRLAAARLRGDVWQLPCVVREFASAAEEAASFVALNQERRPLTKLDLFKAAITAGDQEAGVIVDALQRAGLSLAPNTNNQTMKPGQLTNIGGLQMALRGKGLEAFDIALLLLAEGFTGQVLRFAGTLFPGIAAIAAAELGRTPDLLGAAGAILDTMIDCVRGASQEEWVTDITRQAAEGATFSRREAAIRVFTEAWDECRGELLDGPEVAKAA